MILWLNPFSGVSGDMLLGALLGLGAPLDEVRESIASTGLDGWDLELETVNAGGLVATRARVSVEPQPPERRAGELITLAARARPQRVADIAVSALTSIARVEGALHLSDPDNVHLHELGGIDTIVDTVGVAAAAYLLDVEAVHSAPIGVGSGSIRTSHGTLPAPGPAAVQLLAGARIIGIPATGETVTPTGAALLAALDTNYVPPPEMFVGRTAYGAGTRDFGTGPNVLAATAGQGGDTRNRPMTVLETTVDDVTGEQLGHVINTMLAIGAADAWVSPAVGKKSRPVQVVHVLCPPELEDAATTSLLRETGSLGLRRTLTQRCELPREVRTVDIAGHPVRVKVGPYRAKPEHDDLVAVADATGTSLREVADLAVARIAAEPLFETNAFEHSRPGGRSGR